MALAYFMSLAVVISIGGLLAQFAYDVIKGKYRG